MKVTTLLLPSRVKQGNEATRLRVDRRQIRAFEPVAQCACPRKVLNLRLATVFFGNDVVGFKRQVGIILVRQTILAAILSAFARLAP
jgi:hypothetical protein